MKLLKAMKSAAMVTVMIAAATGAGAALISLITLMVSAEAGFVLLIFMVIFGLVTVLIYPTVEM